LEIADDSYSRKYADGKTVPAPIFETLHYDGSENKATIVGDLTKSESLPENSYDCFICTQTYNFLYDVPEAIAGTYRLLKKGGTVLATVAGLSQISRYDMDRWGDYWRFTDKSAEILFRKADFSDVKITVMGNCLAAVAFLQGIDVEDLPQKNLLDIVNIDYQVVIGIVAIK
jgi:hypothetical protein